MRSFELGMPYFIVGFHDSSLRLPCIATYVFIGVDIFADQISAPSPQYCFQDASSYAAHGDLSSGEGSGAHPDYLTFGSDQLESVLDQRALVEWLQQEHSPFIPPRRGE